MSAYPGMQVMTDANGNVIALLPLTDDLLPNRQFSWANEIAEAINSFRAGGDAPVALVWDELVNDGWTPPGRPTSAITNALRKLGVLK